MTEEHRQMVRGAVQSTRTAYRAVIRDIWFPLGMLDEHGNPSLTRMASVVALIVGSHGRLFDDVPMTWIDFSAIALAAFMTLGQKGMQMFKEWKQGTTTPPTP